MGRFTPSVITSGNGAMQFPGSVESKRKTGRNYSYSELVFAVGMKDF